MQQWLNWLQQWLNWLQQRLNWLQQWLYRSGNPVYKYSNKKTVLICRMKRIKINSFDIFNLQIIMDLGQDVINDVLSNIFKIKFEFG